MTRIRAQDEVAVMPRGAESPDDVIDISRVAFAGRAFIQTYDHLMYTAADGFEVDPRHERYIIPATARHRAAMLARLR
jgi:hypothetical protein